MASVPTGSDPLPQKEPRCTCTTVPRDSASSRTRTGLRMHINAHRNEARHESPKRATPFGGKLNLKLSIRHPAQNEGLGCVLSPRRRRIAPQWFATVGSR
jgi:hypothetical protein